jgi:hypothetical protein
MYSATSVFLITPFLQRDLQDLEHQSLIEEERNAQAAHEEAERLEHLTRFSEDGERLAQYSDDGGDAPPARHGDDSGEDDDAAKQHDADILSLPPPPRAFGSGSGDDDNFNNGGEPRRSQVTHAELEQLKQQLADLEVEEDTLQRSGTCLCAFVALRSLLLSFFKTSLFKLISLL